MIRKQKGFTVVELLVTLAIVGILMVTAVPVYHTWQQRAYGSEAAVMLDHLVTAQISYYVDSDNDCFYPKDSSITIFHDGGVVPEGALEDIKEKLNITIPQGHFLNYIIYGGENEAYIEISSAGNFNLFKDSPLISATVNDKGEVKKSFAGAY